MLEFVQSYNHTKIPLRIPLILKTTRWFPGRQFPVHGKPIKKFSPDKRASNIHIAIKLNCTWSLSHLDTHLNWHLGDSPGWPQNESQHKAVHACHKSFGLLTYRTYKCVCFLRGKYKYKTCRQFFLMPPKSL